MNRLNVTDARCEALFASQLQQSDAPTAQAVVEAIREAVRRFGVHGCAARMAGLTGGRRRWAGRRLGCPRARWRAPSCAPPDRGDQQPTGHR
jgi:hypothetical protein